MKKVLLALLLMSSYSYSFAQEDDLMDILDAEDEPVTHYTTATFKATKIVSSNSIETQGEGQLNFIIQHRFGKMNDGFETFFGLDKSNLRLALEYGVLDNLDIGFGRSSFEQKLDFFIKYRPLRQSTGAKKMPISLAAFASMQIITGKFANQPNRVKYFTSRMSYAYQLMVARKFGKWVSVQITPTLVHRNLVKTKADHNSVFSLGMGTSIRVSGSVRINLEYYWTPEGQISSMFNQEKVLNAILLGVDIETGGHVFQLSLSNSRGMLEKELAAETTGNILNGDLNFGFNITRAFALYDAKKMKQKRKLKKDS